MTILEKIKTRGHWLINVRPTVYNAALLPHQDLQPILRRSVVSLRGWEFPYIDYSVAIRNLLASIEQESEWSSYLEAWSFHRSGQFIDLCGFPEDWEEQSVTGFLEPNGTIAGQRLGIGEVLYRFTEIFEFASRLAITEAGTEETYISIVLKGLNGRRLYNDGRQGNPLFRTAETGMDEFPFSRAYSRTDLIATPRELALDVATEFFGPFGWYPPRELLKSMQERAASR